MLKGITAAATAELINKIDTITDVSRTVKDGFLQNKFSLPGKKRHMDGSQRILGMILHRTAWRYD
jgi:hypothetical protein